MRGKVVLFELSEECVGITPAYAGKSRFPSSTAPYRRDHPRVCGEKLFEMGGNPDAWGSPPRMRGKICADVIVHIQPGSPPACAGKSRSQPRLPCTGRDHPRVCREKFTFFSRGISQSGSPPHVRGKVKPVLWAARVAGITPACAGKRCRSPAFRSMPWDHPRMCGEKADSLVLEGLLEGSPPRVRGKGLLAHDQIHGAGITPAYAGKSKESHFVRYARRDHPRVCGEKALKSWLMSGDVGSPPRMRGKA